MRTNIRGRTKETVEKGNKETGSQRIKGRLRGRPRKKGRSKKERSEEDSKSRTPALYLVCVCSLRSTYTKHTRNGKA